MNFSFQNFVSGLACGTRGNFSCPIEFGKYCNSIANELLGQQDREGNNEARIKDLILALEQQKFSDNLDEDEIKHILALEELIKIQSLIYDLNPALLKPNSIVEATQKILTSSANEGFIVDQVNLRVVEDFPSPYNEASFAAMSYDSVDEKDYGISKGVALKASELRPLYSQILLGHEFAHFIIGQKPSNILARGIEEGIADFVGGVILGGTLIGADLAETVLISMRRRFEQPQFWRLYRDGLLAISGMILLKGGASILDLVKLANREGRHVIKEFEQTMLEGLHVAENIPDNLGLSFAQRVLLLTPDNCLSPLAYYVCRSAKVGQSISEVATDLRLTTKDVEKALNESQNMAFMAIPYKNKVYSNEGPFYFNNGNLRYIV